MNTKKTYDKGDAKFCWISSMPEKKHLLQQQYMYCMGRSLVVRTADLLAGKVVLAEDQKIREIRLVGQRSPHS